MPGQPEDRGDLLDGDATPEKWQRIQMRTGKSTRANFQLNSADQKLKEWVELKANLTGKTSPGALYFWIWFQEDGKGDQGAGWFLDALKVTHRIPAEGIPCNYDSECQDHDQCTQDVCTKGRCTNTIATGIICQDGDACTVDDTCDAKGACQPGKSKVCTDGDVCTEDTCAPASGCLFPPAKDDSACDDGSVCTTGDSCQTGACLGKNKCDDDNPCTYNACAADGSCTSTQLGDGVPCGGGATCQSGKCTVGATSGWGRSVVGQPIQGQTTMAHRLNGEVWGWGWGDNFNGNIGDGTKTGRTTPTKAQAFPGTVEQLAAGSYASCAVVTESGVRKVYCVGFNYKKQLGGASESTRYTSPTLLPGSQHTRQIAMDLRNVCGVRTDGSVWCTGFGYNGVTGQGHKAKETALPLTIAGVSDAVEVALGYYGACALKKDGTVWGWGNDRYGTLAQNDTSTTTKIRKVVQLQGLAGVVQVALSKLGGCARKTDGTVACWGAGNQGQIGNGARPRARPASARPGCAWARPRGCGARARSARCAPVVR